MITNHAYLDNPTFRGMRQSLLKTFDEIYILDLHGNSMKKETAPDGGKDENVFDIRTGVAIALFIKNKKPKKQSTKQYDLFGARDAKYKWLSTNKVDSVDYQSINAAPPYYFFIPRDTSHIQHYNSWPKISDIFPINVTGIVTARDALAIDFDKTSLLTKVQIFQSQDYSDEFVKTAFHLTENYAWKIKPTRKEFVKVNDLENYVNCVTYRPFDNRHIFYHPNIVFRMRNEAMRHMLDENISLVSVRQVKTGDKWQHCFPSQALTESCLISNRTSEICYVFPLYKYPSKDEFDLFSSLQDEKEANISESIYSVLNQKHTAKLSPEVIFTYIYSILYSTSYRETYFEFLKVDSFPVFPLQRIKKSSNPWQPWANA